MNTCTIYRPIAHRFYKQLKAGLSKRLAGVYYRQSLQHTCKLQCLTYSMLRSQALKTPLYRCGVCPKRFVTREGLQLHQWNDHVKICKWLWRIRRQPKIAKQLHQFLAEIEGTPFEQ